MSQHLIAIDIGGTFTDMAAYDTGTGDVRAAKCLTTYDDLFQAIDDCLDARHVRLDAAASFKHGTTLVINSLIQRTGAVTALVTTRGFRDVLEIARGNRPTPFKIDYARSQPLIPRDMRFEVGERMSPAGEPEAEPSRDEVAKLAVTLRGLNVGAVAVSFINAYASPRHEQLVAQWLRELIPGAFVSCGSDLSREWYEYERTSTVAANAFVGPQVSGYARVLDGRLTERGFAGSRFFMGSGTGAISLKQAAGQPVRLVESGPVGGVVGAAAYARALGLQKLVAFDIGGTTAKCALVMQGGIDVRSTYWIGGYERGFPIRSSIIDIVEVGAGGGSIASLDAAGRLKVGPRSAGSTPGPVAYGRGGEEPTVTDANLVLGRIAPANFLADGIRLDVGAARQAIAGRLGTRLGYTGEDAVAELAGGMLSIASVIMAGAIRKVTIERGEDPREFVLFAYGGGGPLHAGELARELNIPLVIIPPHAGIFSAVGMLFADQESDASRTSRAGLADDMALHDAARIFAELEEEAATGLDLKGAIGERRAEHFAELRYVGQMHSVRTLVLPSDDVQALRARFETTYASRYGHANAGVPVETVSLTALVRVAGTRPGLRPLPPGQAAAGPVATRRIFLAASGQWRDVPVYRRADLSPGFAAIGPLVIEDYGCTCLADVGDEVSVGNLGEIRMLLAGVEGGAA